MRKETGMASSGVFVSLGVLVSVGVFDVTGCIFVCDDMLTQKNGVLLLKKLDLDLFCSFGLAVQG